MSYTMQKAGGNCQGGMSGGEYVQGKNVPNPPTEAGSNTVRFTSKRVWQTRQLTVDRVQLRTLT